MSSVRSNRVVLVTGASSGLGLALARRLRETDFRLILTARESSLCRFEREGFRSGPSMWIRPLDVRHEEQRASIVREANERWGGIDVLINNAGVTFRCVVEHFTPECREEQMAVNFSAPMALTRLVLPRMRQKRSGRIINISSVGGMMAMPTMGLYSASKFALEGATESLWYEVRPWNIRVSLVEPGFIHSESFQNTRLTEESCQAMASAGHPYHAHYRFMSQFIARLMQRAQASPEAIAERVLQVMRAKDPPLRVPATFDAHLFALLRRLLPRRLYHRVLYAALPSIRAWGPAASLKR
jgi:short-subunit dehydrogenase